MTFVVVTIPEQFFLEMTSTDIIDNILDGNRFFYKYIIFHEVHSTQCGVVVRASKSALKGGKIQ